MESLIIDPGNRDIVQAICHAQSHPWKIDSVSNKGEGQVALLHGRKYETKASSIWSINLGQVRLGLARHTPWVSSYF